MQIMQTEEHRNISDLQINQRSAEIDKESQIIKIIRGDNFRENTIHFDWSQQSQPSHLKWSKPPYHILRAVTRNVWNGKIFLLKEVFASSREKCLDEMLEYMEETHKTEHNWTVTWRDKDGLELLSYFRGVDEDEVKEKFNFDHQSGKAEIINIKQSPIS